MAVIGCVILGIWIFLSIAVPLFGPWSFSGQNAEIRNQGPSLLHWFGTDRFGRDLFTRVWYGAGISLTVGIVSAVTNGIIGVLYGAASGYAGGRTDMILMRVADIVSAIPSMLYVILITLVNSWQYVGLCMVVYLAGLQGIPDMYREAARLDGVSRLQEFRHITLPLLVPSITTAVVINLINGLKMYDMIVSMSSGGPNRGSLSLSYYIQLLYFRLC